MARRSAASLSIVPASEPVEFPPVPAGLSEAEAALWTGVVESKPTDWFGADSLPVLREYVRAAVMCDTLAVVVADAIRRGDPDEIKGVLDMRDKESRRAVSLATKLRLTPQSKYGPRAADTADRKAGGKRPWQSAS